MPEKEKRHSKLLKRTFKPFKILELFSNTLKIAHNGSEDVVITDRFSKAPPAVTPREALRQRISLQTEPRGTF